jgi:hypothetical protein
VSGHKSLVDDCGLITINRLQLPSPQSLADAMGKVHQCARRPAPRAGLQSHLLTTVSTHGQASPAHDAQAAKPIDTLRVYHGWRERETALPIVDPSSHVIAGRSMPPHTAPTSVMHVWTATTASHDVAHHAQPHRATRTVQPNRDGLRTMQFVCSWQ